MYFEIAKHNAAINAPARCGSTSMAGYFHIENEEQRSTLPLEHTFKFPNPEYKYNILVVRNPYDRLQSAINYVHTHLIQETKLVDYHDHEAIKLWVHGHSHRHLHKHLLTSNPRFYYIDFYNLSKYIPMHHDTRSFNVSGVKWKNEFTKWRSKEQMEVEYQGYLNIKKNWREMPPNVWKLITNKVSKSEVKLLK